MIQKCRTCFTAPVPLPSVLSLETPVEDAPPGRKLLLPRAGVDYPSDSLRMLTRANKVVKTRDVTWEATRSTGAPSPPLPEIMDQGGTVDLEETPEPGGTDV